MNYTSHVQTAPAETDWVLRQPYTHMLREYRAAADKLNARLAELRRTLRQMQQEKAGTRESVRAQKDLERRILLLRDERDDLECVMREIRGYAEMEVQA